MVRPGGVLEVGQRVGLGIGLHRVDNRYIHEFRKGYLMSVSLGLKHTSQHM